MSPRPELRIGDDDREAAVSALGEHYAAGRLTKEEYDERAEHAWAAKTAPDLAPLFLDLPRLQAARPAAPTGPPLRTPRGPVGGRWTGAWVAPLLMVAVALVVLTHLPLFLIFLVAWVLVVRTFRNRGSRYGRGHAGHHPGHDSGHDPGRPEGWVR